MFVGHVGFGEVYVVGQVKHCAAFNNLDVARNIVDSGSSGTFGAWSFFVPVETVETC